VAAIHEETEGNPLFVGEIVRLLTTEGGIAEAAWPSTIPQSVRDVIARRLRHLSPQCNRVLVLASVLGREFALEALARMAGLTQEDLLDTLDQAMANDVISDAPGADYGSAGAAPSPCHRCPGGSPWRSTWTAPRRARLPLHRRKRLRQSNSLCPSRR
jgi:hypothetical protein